jgi:hypothetical protein
MNHGPHVKLLEWAAEVLLISDESLLEKRSSVLKLGILE